MIDRLIRMACDEFEPEEDFKDLLARHQLRIAQQSRYLFRSSTYRKGNLLETFEKDLNEDPVPIEGESDEEEPWLNDEEFLQKYRMSRNAFKILLDKIKDHAVFNNPNSKRKQVSVAYQLMTWLKFVGTEGAGGNNSNQRNTFKISRGSAEVYKTRVAIAIRTLSREYIYWPSKEERKVIAKEIFQQYHFPHCVSLADGTLFPLAFEPETEDAPDYSGRKFGYSLSAMIFCDHKRRIRHYTAGFPGSAHDSRVFKASTVAMNPDEHFEPREYCLGDSAFENDWFMVAAFKKPKDLAIPAAHEKFNTMMARLRIITEHCIGMLKGRFP